MALKPRNPKRTPWRSRTTGCRACGQVGARPERLEAGRAQPLHGLDERGVPEVAEVVVGQPDRVEPGVPQPGAHRRVGRERVAALGGRPGRRQGALQVPDGEVGGGEAAAPSGGGGTPGRPPRRPGSHPAAEHDVADDGERGDLGGGASAAVVSGYRPGARSGSTPPTSTARTPGPTADAGTTASVSAGRFRRSAGRRVTVSRPAGWPSAGPVVDRPADDAPREPRRDVDRRTPRVHGEHQRLGVGRVHPGRRARGARGGEEWPTRSPEPDAAGGPRDVLGRPPTRVGGAAVHAGEQQQRLRSRSRRATSACGHGSRVPDHHCTSLHRCGRISTSSITERRRMALEHALLVALSEQPASGLDLAKRFGRSIGFFWHATHQQIYRVLARMDGDGWVTVTEVAQTGRPDKKVYAVSPAGRPGARRLAGRADPDGAAAQRARGEAARRRRSATGTPCSTSSAPTWPTTGSGSTTTSSSSERRLPRAAGDA